MQLKDRVRSTETRVHLELTMIRYNYGHLKAVMDNSMTPVFYSAKTESLNELSRKRVENF